MKVQRKWDGGETCEPDRPDQIISGHKGRRENTFGNFISSTHPVLCFTPRPSATEWVMLSSCLSVYIRCLSVCLFASTVYVFLSVYLLSVCLFVCLYICSPVSLSAVCLSTCQSIRCLIFLFGCLYVCLPVSLSIVLSSCLSVCLPASIYVFLSVHLLSVCLSLIDICLILSLSVVYLLFCLYSRMSVYFSVYLPVSLLILPATVFTL